MPMRRPAAVMLAAVALLAAAATTAAAAAPPASSSAAASSGWKPVPRDKYNTPIEDCCPPTLLWSARQNGSSTAPLLSKDNPVFRAVVTWDLQALKKAIQANPKFDLNKAKVLGKTALQWAFESAPSHRGSGRGGGTKYYPDTLKEVIYYLLCKGG